MSRISEFFAHRQGNKFVAEENYHHARASYIRGISCYVEELDSRYALLGVSTLVKFVFSVLGLAPQTSPSRPCWLSSSTIWRCANWSWSDTTWCSTVAPLCSLWNPTILYVIELTTLVSFYFSTLLFAYVSGQIEGSPQVGRSNLRVAPWVHSDEIQQTAWQGLVFQMKFFWLIAHVCRGTKEAQYHFVQSHTYSKGTNGTAKKRIQVEKWF